MVEKVVVSSSQVVQSIEEIVVQKLSFLKAQISVGVRKKAEGVTFTDTQEEQKQKASRIFGAEVREYAVKDIQKEFFCSHIQYSSQDGFSSF